MPSQPRRKPSSTCARSTSSLTSATARRGTTSSVTASSTETSTTTCRPSRAASRLCSRPTPCPAAPTPRRVVRATPRRWQPRASLARRRPSRAATPVAASRRRKLTSKWTHPPPPLLPPTAEVDPIAPSSSQPIGRAASWRVRRRRGRLLGRPARRGVQLKTAVVAMQAHRCLWRSEMRVAPMALAAAPRRRHHTSVAVA